MEAPIFPMSNPSHLAARAEEEEGVMQMQQAEEGGREEERWKEGEEEKKGHLPKNRFSLLLLLSLPLSLRQT